jgi:hypothetical protein
MTLAVSGYGNTAHSAAQPLRLWFGLSVAIGQASIGRFRDGNVICYTYYQGGISCVKVEDSCEYRK